MPRIVGLGHMSGGNFPMTYGLGHNGLEDVANYSRAVITALDRPCTVITTADAGPATCVALSDLGAATLVTCADAGPVTVIAVGDRPATIITSADGKG